MYALNYGLTHIFLHSSRVCIRSARIFLTLSKNEFCVKERKYILKRLTFLGRRNTIKEYKYF